MGVYRSTRMSDDQRPPSQNPFIRFKQHVDARIGTGISVITGRSKTNMNTSSPQEAHTQPQPSQQQFNPSTGAFLPVATATMSQNPPGGEAFPTSTSYWNDWAQLSPYSPYNMRHLRQPVPSDLPADMVDDAHLFGFEDAFEDLLASTRPAPEVYHHLTDSANRSPLPLLDLRRHAHYKRHVRSTFPTGEPPMLWVNRLKDRGLLPLPFPAANVHQRGPALAAGSEQLALQMGLSVPEEPADVLRRLEEARRRAADVVMPEFEELKRALEGFVKNMDGYTTFDPAEIFRKAQKVAEEIEKDMGVEEAWARTMPDHYRLFQRVLRKSRAFADELSAMQRAQNNEEDAELEAFLAEMGINDTPGGKQSREQEEDSWLQSLLAETGLTETPRGKRWQREQEEKKQPQPQKGNGDPLEDLWLELLAAMDAFDNPGEKEQEAKTTAQQQPDTEGDLYSAFESALDKADASIGAWAKILQDLFFDTDVKDSWLRTWAPPKQAEEARPVEVVEYDRIGGKTVRSTTEHVDPVFGLVHQKTETKKLDASGRQVSCETRYSVRPGPEKEKSAPKKVEFPAPPPALGPREKKSSTVTEAKPSGWFWR